MRLQFRRALAILSVASLFALAIYFSCSDNEMVTMLMQPSNLKWLMEDRGFVLNTPGCQIPDWNPFHPTVSRFFVKAKTPYKCPGKPPFLKSNPHAVISIDYDILLKYYNEKRKNISCTYRPILRNPGPEDKKPDSKYSFGSYKKLQFNVTLEDEFIFVNCSLKYARNVTQFIALTPLKNEIERIKAPKSKNLSEESPLSIIILGIDSVSKLNFLRHFKKTLAFLRENLFYYELKGYTKVGDNTFPNLVPLFTGHFQEEYWNGSVTNIFFDDVPFIWKNYSERGYRTFYAEDAPNIGTFHYLKKGFRRPPTDYYFRPFALAVEKLITDPDGKAQCLNSVLEIDILFNYFRDFVMTMEGRPFFAYAFSTRLTHDKLNLAGYADEPTARLLKSLHSEGVLNKTLLIFLSDHGIRFGSIRQTYIGKFEERMPFIFLFFPPWFMNKYPEYEKNLHVNQDRLTTPFDVHATLVHMLQLNRQPSLELNETLSKITPHGISLLDPISKKRTCEMASIKPHWCTCQTHEPVPITDTVVINCANALVDTLNKILKPFADECATLTLRYIIEARCGQVSDVVLRFLEQKNRLMNRPLIFGRKIKAPVDYLIIVKVNPSEGIFEGTVRYDDEEGTYKVLDAISRLDRYGNQSICMKDSRLRKFCFCVKQNSEVLLYGTR